MTPLQYALSTRQCVNKPYALFGRETADPSQPLSFDSVSRENYIQFRQQYVLLTAPAPRPRKAPHLSLLLITNVILTRSDKSLAGRRPSVLSLQLRGATPFPSVRLPLFVQQSPLMHSRALHQKTIFCYRLPFGYRPNH